MVHAAAPAAPPHILVIEDDPPIAGGVVRGLRAAGFSVALAVDGEQALREAAATPPSLVVLDLNLPDRSGFDLLDAWRGGQSAPVIILTARTDLEVRVRCFGLGAADYLPKPFWLEELLARVRARLGLGAGGARREIRWADVTLDLDARTVRREGAGEVPLTPHELTVLAYLAGRAGRALTRAQIAAHALPPNEERVDRVVDCHVARLRRKLGDAGARIRTVWGVGYRFDADEGAP
jgi:DNA-binding response OmpR family regulator